MARDEAIVRLATKDDAAFLPDIERSAGVAFRSVPGLEWISDDKVEPADFHQIHIDEGTVWVADVRGHLIGFITTQIFDTDSGDTLHIWELAVADGYQGQGIGRKLMNAARDHVSKKNFSALTLTTFRDVTFNEAFYQKLGFQTLEPRDLSLRLQEILAAEIKDGLPAERRCAMQLSL